MPLPKENHQKERRLQLSRERTRFFRTPGAHQLRVPLVGMRSAEQMLEEDGQVSWPIQRGDWKYTYSAGSALVTPNPRGSERLREICPWGTIGQTIHLVEPWMTWTVGGRERVLRVSDPDDAPLGFGFKPAWHIADKHATRLKIIGVGVRRLNEISEHEAYAEGFAAGGTEEPGLAGAPQVLLLRRTAVEAFLAAWNTAVVHGGAPWNSRDDLLVAANPWVWVLHVECDKP